MVANLFQNTYLLRTMEHINAQINETSDHDDQSGEDIYDISDSEES